MALAFSQSGIVTSAMASSYWPGSDTTPFASSGNPGGGGALSPAAFNISSSLSSAANAHATYNVSQGSQYSHGGYSTYLEQGEQMSYPSHSQSHHTQAQIQAHRPVSGIGAGVRQLPVLRPHAQQAFVASLSAQNSSSASLSSPLSPGSSGSSSLTPSLTSSSLSTVSSNPTSSLPPLSPHAHHTTVHTQTQQNARERVNVHSHAYSLSGSTHQAARTSVETKSSHTTRIEADLGAQAQMLYPFDSHDPPSYGHEYGHTRYHSQLQANAHSGSEYTNGYSTSSPSSRTRPTSSPIYTHITSHAARPTSDQSPRSPATDQFQNRARLRGKARGYVKAEPDLEDPRHLERSPDLTGDGDEGGGARFVMEHPYPYAYATTSRDAKDRGNLRSTSFSPPPYTEHGLDYEASNNDSSFPHSSKEGASQQARHDLQQQQPNQPHTLTAPLRAVNASNEMRACMGVFRLNPFAQLNGVTLKCGFVASSEEGTFHNRKSNKKKKGKGKKGKKGRGAGKKSRKHAESDDEDDVYAEMTEDLEADEELDDNTPTWDGFPAGPLAEKPVLIEFQLYCDGMEIEDDGGDTMRDANEGSFYEDESGDGQVMNGVDTTDCYGRSRTSSITTNPATSGSVLGRGAERNKGETRDIDSAQSSRCVGIVDYANNTADGSGRGPEYGRGPEERNANNTQSHVRQPRGGSGSMFEYLHLDLDDVDMEAERWGSGEASPATPYSLTQSRIVGRPFDSFMQAQIPTQRSDSIPTCANSLTTSSGSSSSVHPNSLSSVSQSSTTTITNGVIGRTEPIRARYIDSAGCMRLSDSTQFPPPPFGQATPASTSTEQGSNSGAGSPFYGLAALDAGTETVNGSATLQQLRTQAALRAVSAHASQTQSQAMHGQYRGVSETASGNTYRSAGAGGGSSGAAGTGTVIFTPTPASLAAEMQAGSLGSGRLGMSPHQQSRMRASSLAYPGSHISQGQGQSGAAFDSYSQSPQMMSASQQAGSSSTYSSSGCAYTDYLATAESDSGSGAFDHNLQAPERRWSDVSQRVQS